MDQATFFVMMYSLLGSLRCPLDDVNRDKLIDCLDEIQDDLGSVCVVNNEVVTKFDDSSRMFHRDIAGEFGTEMISRLLNATTPVG